MLENAQMQIMSHSFYTPAENFKNGFETYKASKALYCIFNYDIVEKTALMIGLIQNPSVLDISLALGFPSFFRTSPLKRAKQTNQLNK
jgi:hypothetical protein